MKRSIQEHQRGWPSHFKQGTDLYLSACFCTILPLVGEQVLWQLIAERPTHLAKVVKLLDTLQLLVVSLLEVIHTLKA